MKKILQFFLVVVTMFATLPVLVNAQTSDTLVKDTSYTYYVATTKFDDLSYWAIGGENPIKRTSDGSYVYCIQAHVEFIDGSPVVGYGGTTDKLVLSNLTEEEIEKLELIAYYGYGYGNHTSMDWYAATQLLIWEITEKVATPYPIAEGDRTLTRINKYDDMMNEIRDLVSKHGRTVSFNNQTLKMKVGETVTLHDDYEVLSNYFTVESNDSLDMKINGSDLVITAKTGYEGTINLNAKENDNIPMLYDGANQKCYSRGDPTYINGKINLKAETEFKINKNYGSSNSGTYIPEENAEFELYNADTDELISTLVTDENGEASIYLGFGNYRLHQIKGNEGYKFVKDYIFTINGKHKKEIVFFQNEKIKSELHFTKVDIDTNIGLANALVAVYNADTDELVYRGYTSTGGVLSIDLEYGNYYLVEEKAPAGYEINSDKIYFSVTEDGEIINAVMKDVRIVEVPDTVIHENHMIEICAIIMFVMGIGVVVYENKRK